MYTHLLIIILIGIKFKYEMKQVNVCCFKYEFFGEKNKIFNNTL